MEGTKVGVFDSGVGGLTVLGECAKLLPCATFYYYGDNGYAPYGNRSAEEILRRARLGVERFLRFGVTAVVLACNTVTAVCAETLRREYPVPIVGIEPAIKPAGKECRNALVLATVRTGESVRLKELIAREKFCRFTVAPLAGLAGAIEGKMLRGEKLTLSNHLPSGEYDGVVLGCTHYSFFRNEIAEFYSAKAFDGNFGVAKRLCNILSQYNTGIADHLQPEQNPNICFSKNPNISPRGRVFFLGKWGKNNEFVYKTNICFRKN